MKRTNKYELTYYEKNDYTSSLEEMQRWETLDVQLYALFSILGNGVLTGWDIVSSSGFDCVVTPGSGHVSFTAVESTTNTVITLVPESRNYIYAVLNADSYWTKGVSFNSSVFTDTNDNVLFLGYVDTDDQTITDINMDGRAVLGFVSLITNAVKAHRHIGGTDNPPPVNLATEVEGSLSPDNIPDLDASVIQTGTVDTDRLPLIDHITQLSNQGVLTHAQLDDFVNTLSLPDQTLMGEVSTSNFLQLVLALKHVYPDIDEFLVNEISFIPGISPDDYIDTAATTATVDTRPASAGGTHKISGSSSTGFRTYTRIWDSEDDFDTATLNRTVVDGDSVTLNIKENTLIIDEFEDLSQWTVQTLDYSSIPSYLTADTSIYVVPPQSGKLNVGDTVVDLYLDISKSFDAQDWSGYNYLKFFIKTTDVQHGDIYFYLNDNTYGIQNSYVKILDRNAPTINIDTLQNGWQEVTVDIRSFNRQYINKIGFYVSTQKGWDTSKGFYFNLDNIYLTTGNLYETDGYARIIYGSDFLYRFWRIRWDDIIPTDSESTGVSLQVRTRVANSIAALPLAPWTAYYTTSGYIIPIPVGDMYKYIEMEFYFTSSTTENRSITVKKIYLDFYAADVDSSFEYDSQADWETVYLFNIDTQTIPGSMIIDGSSEIGDIYYGTDESAYQIDSNLATLYKVTGSLLPRSTYQVLNDLSPSLGLVTGVARGDGGSFWLSDTDNDRIVNLNKSGALIQGFMGSFLSEPIDPYELSNVAAVTNTTSEVSSETALTPAETIEVLHSIYNYEEGVLYIVCSADIEDIYATGAQLNLNNISLKIGSQKIYFNDALVELLGVDETKSNLWSSLLTSTDDRAVNIKNFAFSSHVLKITPQGANKTLLDTIVNEKQPSVVIYSPLEQEQVGQNVTVKFFLYNFVLGTGIGETAIRVTLDGVSQTIYNTSISYSGLTLGKHTIKAELLKADGTAYTNIEAVAEGTFVVMTSSYSLPYFYFTTPCINQIYSASPVKVEFVLDNFAIVPNGQHVRYQVDSEVPVDYYSSDPILLEDLDPGEHTIQIYTVDENGTTLSYTYGSAEVDFIVGLNSNALVKLYVDRDGIFNKSGTASCPTSRTYVDVDNIYMRNIYSPIDVQVILPEDNDPTVLVAKLRSPSWITYLGDSTRAEEYVKRIEFDYANSVSNVSASNVTSETISTLEAALDPALRSVAIKDLIYDTGYLDGHSVVELNMVGDTIFSNNDAKIAPTKEIAKNILGSCEKIGSDELLIGDAWNKRAIITSTNTISRVSSVNFEFESDRYVSDFHIVIQDDIVIEVNDGSISEDELFIRSGTIVTWENNSSAPISIYSGTTDYDLFYQNPDLNLYGSEFYSPVLQPGQNYSRKFNAITISNWFVYPTIITGKITTTNNRISDRDNYIILENDMLLSPYSSRVIKVNCYGGVLWKFGEGYLVQPRDARPLLDNKVLIST